MVVAGDRALPRRDETDGAPQARAPEVTVVFERCAPETREIVGRAESDARRLGHGWIGCEHLLLALTRGGGEVAATLRTCGLTPANVDAAIVHIVGVNVSDRDALATIGIDLDTVRARVEATFGPGALERSMVPTRARRLRRRDRRCHARRPAGSGPLPLSPRAKRCFELAVDTATPELVTNRDLAIALLARTDTAATRILTYLNTNVDALRATLAR